MPDPPETRVAVVIMAKTPLSGHVKTRLTPALTPDEAAALYAAMLADRCTQLRALRGVIPAIVFADGGGDRVAAAAGFARIEQPVEGGLGAGLAAAAAYFLSRDTPVVLVDSDSPDLPIAYLRRAVESLRAGTDDVVIGPTADGGYYLLGLSRPAPELFRDIPWSTDGVVAATVERAKERGLRVCLLPSWWDVDTPADLEQLEARLLHASWPAHSAEWVRKRTRSHRAVGRRGSARHELWDVPWQTLWSRPVYATPWLRVREDAVITPAGDETTYSVVDCGQCVGVLPFVDHDTVLMVRQHRYVAGRVTWEMPTGGVGQGEPPERAARRELAKEAQLAAGRP